VKGNYEASIGIAVESSPAPRPLSHANARQASAFALRDTGDRRPNEHGFRTIVVLLDGSLPAEHGLPHAMAIARVTGATLRLVRVFSHLDDIEPWQFSGATAEAKPSKYEKQEYLARIARRIERLDGLRTETVLIDSPNTVAALTQGAAGADLVVIGSRRRRFASRLWWLNTVDQLRRQLSVPMMVTRGNSAPVDFSVSPRFKQILVPLDGSVLGQTILDSASRLSRACDGSLTLLNVQDEQRTLSFLRYRNPWVYLLSTIQRLKEAAVDSEAQIVTASHGADQVLASYANSEDVDLIAIATRGDSGLSRMMRGSSADYLLRHTKLPILLQSVPE